MLVLKAYERLRRASECGIRNSEFGMKKIARGVYKQLLLNDAGIRVEKETITPILFLVWFLFATFSSPKEKVGLYDN